MVIRHVCNTNCDMYVIPTINDTKIERGKIHK